MTRKKKTRSLKRIHSVKTGNVSKLKRDGTTDRQYSNLKSKTKPKSVYQKFLDENPEAAEKQIQAESAINEAKGNNPTAAKDAAKPEQIKAKSKTKPKEEEKERKDEREPDLLSQLDNKNFNDFY